MMENVKNLTPAELKAFEKAQKAERKANRIPNLFDIIWREVRASKLAFGALILLVLLVVGVNIAGLFIDQQQTMRVVLGRQNLSPSQFGPMGTDSAGRDMFMFMVLGTRTSLNIAFLVTAGAAFIGHLVGLVLGFYGGIIDLIGMRLMEVIIMVPTIMIIIVVSTVLPNYDTPQFIMLLIATTWIGTAFGFRARVLQESAKDYVLASKTLGTPNMLIMIKKVLPNVVSFIMVTLILSLAFSIGLETGLTVIGRGLPFNTPSIGAMIASAMDPSVMRLRPWQWIPAAVLIVVVTMCIRAIGNAVSRAVNPKQRR